jgi:hypothetical protein
LTYVVQDVAGKVPGIIPVASHQCVRPVIILELYSAKCSVETGPLWRVKLLLDEFNELLPPACNCPLCNIVSNEVPRPRPRLVVAASFNYHVVRSDRVNSPISPPSQRMSFKRNDGNHVVRCIDPCSRTCWITRMVDFTRCSGLS